MKLSQTTFNFSVLSYGSVEASLKIRMNCKNSHKKEKYISNNLTYIAVTILAFGKFRLPRIEKRPWSKSRILSLNG